MNKKESVALFFGKVLLVLVLGFLACSRADSEKPNFIFILIDDLGYKDVGYMGPEYYKTPHIDQLASEGMIFTQAYTNAANCAPTRASLLSGQYSPRHGVYTVGVSDRGKTQDRRIIPVVNSKTVPLENIFISEALHDAGYVSAAIGKWNVGNTPEQQGFDVGVSMESLGFKRGHFNEQGEYLADRLTDEAVKFIQQNAENPFFLYLAHYGVHTPIDAPAEMIAKYTMLEEEGCYKSPVYAAMIESIDKSVGRIISTLEELNIDKNSVVTFFSDNGGYGPITCMDPLRGSKGMFYEGGIRVPMIVKWPGKISGGSVCHKPVIGIDFYPTFLDIAGISRPENKILDGISIYPLLQGSGSLSRESIFWHFPAYLGAYNGGMEDARDTIFRTRPVSVIRKDNWKLLLFYEEWVLDGGRDSIQSNNSIELYNLEEDLGEKVNLANINTEKRDELLKDLFNWLVELKAPLPNEPNSDYKPRN